MLEKKYLQLKNSLKEMQSVLIGYSGGVDSTLLVKVASDVLGDRVYAATAQSETYVASEYAQAKKVIKELGVKHIVFETSELQIANYSENPVDRCYYCKLELYSQLKQIAEKHDIQFVIDGSNADDIQDYRPGLKALAELDIQSPLKEAGLTKNEIRQLSAQLELPTWDKPAVACLGSRFPYGTTITAEKLQMLEKAEVYLHDMGIQQVRVRHHDQIARIEVLPKDIPVLLDPDTRETLNKKFKEIGYKYVTIDLEGYRSGSMNEILPLQH